MYVVYGLSQCMNLITVEQNFVSLIPFQFFLFLNPANGTF